MTLLRLEEILLNPYPPFRRKEVRVSSPILLLALGERISEGILPNPPPPSGRGRIQVGERQNL